MFYYLVFEVIFPNFWGFLFDLAMSDFKGSPKLGGSWSSDHEPTKSKVSTRDDEIVPGSTATVVVTLLHGPMDLEVGSFMILKGEFLGDPE